MKTEYLKSFVAVVENRSFSGAAKSLFLSQPAISTHIKQLEEELGTQLLTRSTKNIRLTEAGLVFYPYALRLLETEKEALGFLQGTEENMKGSVQIVASTVPANYILADFVAHMKGKYPQIVYHVDEYNSAQVYQKVLHFEAELGVCGAFTQNAKCVYTELFTGEIVLITPNTPFYAGFKGKLGKGTLEELSYIVRETGSGTGAAVRNVERMLGLSEENMHIVAQLGSTETVKRAVAGKLGCAFIERLAVADFVRDGRVLMFDFPEIDTSRRFYMVRHHDRMMSQALAITMRELESFCTKLNV